MSKKEIYILVGGGCFIILCTVAVLFGGFYYLVPALKAQMEPVQEIVTVEVVNLPNPNGLTLGDVNAKVTIEVFEDFQCPACKQFSDQIEPLIVQNLVATGKAKYMFRHYPFIDGLGAEDGGESDQAANATMCANEQGKFWEMKSVLYANWNGENQGAFNDRRLEAMADSLHLDMNSFRDCFSSNTYIDLIQSDYEYGNDMDVYGTPTVLVNGVKVGEKGYIASYQEIVEAVEAAIAAAP